MKSILIFSVCLFYQFVGSAQIIDTRIFTEHGLQGSTTIYDYKNKEWFFTDSLDAKRITLPASTFKIMNSLIALETGAVKNVDEVIKWDGKERTLFGGAPVPAWNQDTDLRAAFRNSTIWFYVKLAERIGRKKYRHYLQQADYGDGDLSEKGIDFWNYGDFGISPVGQINFLIQLYEDRLPFSKAIQNTVKSIMISEASEGMIYHDKTGWARKKGHDIGWWVGYLQADDRVYFFATRISKEVTADNPDFANLRKRITKQILQQVMRYH